MQKLKKAVKKKAVVSNNNPPGSVTADEFPETMAVETAKPKKVTKKKVTKKKVTRAKTIKPEPLNIDEIKKSKVEWFDERFYKLHLPLNIDQSFIENIPVNYIYCELGSPEIEVFLPSVSTIKGNSEPKPYLATWRGDVGNSRADQIIDQALRKGSNIHDAIDKLNTGTDIIYQNLKTKNISLKEIREYKKRSKRQIHIIQDQSEMVQIARYKRLIDMLQPEIKETEQSVFNLSECYAGTLDGLWFLNAGSYHINSDRTQTQIEQGLYVVDFKTGKGYDEVSTYIQLIAYLMAHPQHESIVGCIGIHLNNDNKTGIEGVKIYKKTKDELLEFWERFLTYKKIFFFNNPASPKRFEFPAIISLNNKPKKLKS